MACRAAIDRDNQLRAIVDQTFNRRRIWPITLKYPVGNINLRLSPMGLNKPAHQRRGRAAIDIIVAEYRNRLALLDSIGKAHCAAFHIAHGMGVRHQVFQCRIKRVLNRLKRGATGRQYPPQQFRQTVSLCNGTRDLRLLNRQALAPDIVPRRSHHTEKYR